MFVVTRFNSLTGVRKKVPRRNDGYKQMNNNIKKFTQGWKAFKADYKETAYCLENAIAGVVLSSGATSAAYLAIVLVLPPPVPQLLALGAVASTLSAVTCSALAVAVFVREKREMTVIESFANDNGQTVEGPRWAIKRLVKAQSEHKKAFNKLAELKTDPLVGEALANVKFKTSAAPVPF